MVVLVCPSIRRSDWFDRANTDTEGFCLSEVDCGPPPKVPHAQVVWSSLGGAEVRYGCDHGYRNMGGSDGSVCGTTGQWVEPELLCQGTMSTHIIYLF